MPGTGDQPTNPPNSSAKRPVFRFLVVFAAVIAIFYAAASMHWFRDKVFPANLDLNASMARSVLRVLGHPVERTRHLLYSPRFALEVRRGCDALEPTVIFAAAVLAFPATWKRRAAGIVFGALALCALNIVRIVSLFLIGVYAPNMFQTMHLYVWQTVFVLAGLGLWLTWAWGAGAAPLAPRSTSHAAR